MTAPAWAETVRAGMRLPQSPPLFVYGLTVFVSSCLVFWVQPLAVRGLLPTVGGSPLAWNTAMLFFQGTLLAGYLLAHLLVRQRPSITPRLRSGSGQAPSMNSGARGQIAVLALLWSAALLAAWSGGVTLFGDTPPESGVVLPALWVLGTLAGTCGPGCLAVSMLSPLVSSWFARTNEPVLSSSKDETADPYVLYAVSNVGSIGILLVYPFVLEPLFGVALQRQLWTAVFALLFLPLLVLGLASRRKAGPLVITHADVMRMFGTGHRASLPRRTALRVLLLALLPSALLHAVTLRLSTDVASTPFLWVLPLALYLGTYALAFGRGRLFSRWREPLSSAVMPAALILFAVFHGLTDTGLLWGAFHLAVFGVVAFYCHGLLWELRPGEDGDLTGFYAFLSAGGLMGGVVSVVMAPVVFVEVWEYPVLFCLAALFLPAAAAWGSAEGASWSRSLAGAALAAVAAWGLHLGDWPLWLRIGVVVCLAVSIPQLLALCAWPMWLTAALLAVSLAPAGARVLGSGDVIARERTWFGVYRVTETTDLGTVSRRLRLFRHGTTLHGLDWIKADGSTESRTSYYAPDGPHGDVMRALRARGGRLRIGLVGLGTGSLLCYARPGDSVKVYEIDAAVVRLARAHFSGLRDCAPEADIKIGDGRLSLARQATGSLDVLFLDAFSSGSIPVHLLTLEALRDYLRVLEGGGVLVIHTSNRHVDLKPPLALAARELGIKGLAIHHEVAPGAAAYPLSMTTGAVVLASEGSVIEEMGLAEGWRPLAASEPTGWRRAWRDDRSSLVPYLR